MSVFTDIFEHCVGSFSLALRLEKEIKKDPDWKGEEVKLSLFEDDMISKILKNPHNSYYASK